jgi:3-keto-disaccharide hydrolase
MATIDAIMSVGSLSAEKEEVFMPFASRNARGILGLAIILAAIGGTTGAGEKPKPPPGFIAIFNGKNLDGWEGNPKYWLVEDGCLMGLADGKLDYNRFILWRGGKPKNFEVRVKVKVSTAGNSGIQYRSVERPELGESVVAGYQCDVVANRADYNGMLYEERGRRILAHTGEKVIIDTKGQPWVVGEFLVKEFKANEWHDFRVLAEGNHLQHWIDGHQTVDVIDLDEKNRRFEGVLGVQVHVGPPMKIQYRDFFLKKLPDNLPIIAPEQAKIPDDAKKVVPQGKDRPKTPKGVR